MLAAALVQTSCASTTSFSAVELAPLSRSEPVADAVVAKAVAHAPNDATWVQLEQGFALLRHAQGDDDVARARRHFEAAFASFEDLRDPENLNVAFTADADTPYRGRPHERVLAATTLALTDAANGRCDLALPTLRAAEFLDVRWQRLAFGTDAAVVYALARWCLEQTDGRPEDKRRAEDGLRLTLRYSAAAETVRALVQDAVQAVPRADAVAVRIAGELAELGLLTTLANNPRVREPDEILVAGLEAATSFVRRIDELLDLPEFQAALEAARETSGGSIGSNRDAARRFIRGTLAAALDDLGLAIRRPMPGAAPQAAFDAAIAAGEVAASDALRQLGAQRIAFTFVGSGPVVVREGQYREIARLAPRDGAEATLALRRTAVVGDVVTCGIRGSVAGATATSPAAAPADLPTGFTAVLCGKRGVELAGGGPADALEVWSSSTQATTVVGRRFDAILKGRAAFKAGTEGAARVATWTALSLWQTGFELLGSCGPAPPPPPDAKTPRKGQKPDGDGEACVAVAMATIAAGAVVAAVGGAVWLAGAAVNPAADPRFVNALPESVALVVARPADATSSSGEDP
jgi:hypothetical protein